MPTENYRLTPNAQSDLVGIRRYTDKQRGRAQSQKYLSELRQTIWLLVEMPALGKSRLDVGEGVLSFSSPPFARSRLIAIIKYLTLYEITLHRCQHEKNNCTLRRWIGFIGGRMYGSNSQIQR
ncbi:MAG: hypothetical protein CR978_01735 [Gammaproteobacteria bacterium]|nr:MAG: hypothetical protein CR978_01735 [Gammaproteobacteria bacterium]